MLDAAALAAGQALPTSQQAALGLAGLLLLNKAEHLDASSRESVQAQLPALPLYLTGQAQLPVSPLPGSEGRAQAPSTWLGLPEGATALPTLWRDPREPICQVQEQVEGWSIGWRWHPSQQFELMRVQQWLATLPWRRAKLVMQTNAGWLSANMLDGEAPHWRSSEWRKDSRLELIFSAAQDPQALAAGLQRCVLSAAELT